jgi:hypothetical protein
MKSTPLVAGLALLMATTSGIGLAQGQPSDPNYQAQQQTYEQQQRQYQNAQSDYQNRTSDYEAKREAYRQARARFERERADYDARYGEGSYARYFHEHREDYDARYGRGAWERDFGEQRDRADRRDGDYRDRDYRDGDNRANADYYRNYRDSACEQRSNDHAVAGGVIGALAGAALGSNVASGGGRTGGAIIGAVLGGAVGANVGRSTARCDQGGYYFSYDQTYPYREGDWEHGRSGRYDNDYYSRRGCRLAVAPAHAGDGDEYRYVRVCPDERGHYRITD